MFFGIFATHLVYLGELSQIKYTAVKNKSLHYRWFIFAFPSNIWFFYKIDLRISIPVDADFLIDAALIGQQETPLGSSTTVWLFSLDFLSHRG